MNRDRLSETKRRRGGLIIITHISRKVEEMPARKVVKFEFVCDSCKHLVTRDSDEELPVSWKSVENCDGEILMLCGSCTAQFQRALEVLGLEATWL